MIDYEKIEKLMKEYRDIREGYIVFKYESWLHNHTKKATREYKVNMEFRESISSDSFDGLIEKFESLIREVNSGYLSVNKIGYRGFVVTIFEHQRGYSFNARSEDREIQRELDKTYIYDDAQKEACLFIDAYLMGRG